jgi:hypothetical protein
MPTWFQNTLEAAGNVLRQRGEDYVFAPLTKKNGVDAPSEALVKGEDYITIRVRSFHIVNVRVGTGKFYASVQARAKYLRALGPAAEWHKVLVPDLKEMDSAHVDRVVVVDKPVFGPVPWLGDLSLELGLFSVKATDLAAPYLKLLIGLAEKTGGLQAGAALPITEVLRQAAALLFGNDKQASLEIGVDTNWSDMTTGTWLLMRAPRDNIDLENIRLHATDGRITDANMLAVKEFPYLVFSIERSQQRDDWMTIPAITAAMDEIACAVRAARTEQAEALLVNLLAALEWMPELTTNDAQRLAAKLRAKIPQSIQQGTGIGRGAVPAPFPDLASLDLYGPQDT